MCLPRVVEDAREEGEPARERRDERERREMALSSEASLLLSESAYNESVSEMEPSESEE